MPDDAKIHPTQQPQIIRLLFAFRANYVAPLTNLKYLLLHSIWASLVNIVTKKVYSYDRHEYDGYLDDIFFGKETVKEGQF
jgi:hypothetical protein